MTKRQAGPCAISCGLLHHFWCVFWLDLHLRGQNSTPKHTTRKRCESLSVADPGRPTGYRPQGRPPVCLSICELTQPLVDDGRYERLRTEACFIVVCLGLLQRVVVNTTAYQLLYIWSNKFQETVEHALVCYATPVKDYLISGQA